MQGRRKFSCLYLSCCLRQSKGWPKVAGNAFTMLKEHNPYFLFLLSQTLEGILKMSMWLGCVSY